MSNYEKALELLNAGVANKHFTFAESKCIVLDLGGTYAGFIMPGDIYIDVAQLGTHVSFGNIDLDKMMVFDRSNRRFYNFPIKNWEYE